MSDRNTKPNPETLLVADTWSKVRCRCRCRGMIKVVVEKQVLLQA